MLVAYKVHIRKYYTYASCLYKQTHMEKHRHIYMYTNIAQMYVRTYVHADMSLGDPVSTVVQNNKIINCNANIRMYVTT